MEGSMVSRLLAAALPDSSTSAKGARCFCTSGNTGAGAAPMSGSVMGRRLDGRRLAAGAPASAATAAAVSLAGESPGLPASTARTTALGATASGAG